MNSSFPTNRNVVDILLLKLRSNARAIAPSLREKLMQGVESYEKSFVSYISPISNLEPLAISTKTCMVCNKEKGGNCRKCMQIR